MAETTPETIYRLEGQPARFAGVAGEKVEVYVGRGEWVEYDDPSGSMAYASKLTPEEATALIAEWDEDAGAKDESAEGDQGGSPPATPAK